MRLSEPKLLAALPKLDVELLPGASLAERTSLGIGGTSDVLLIRRHAVLPDLVGLLHEAGLPYRFLGGGTNLLVRDGELPWLVLQLARHDPDLRVEGNSVYVDAAADLGRTVTFCARRDLGGMEGLIGVPGTIGGALRMNAGAYGMQIGTYVREVELYRAAARRLETLRGDAISFEYRHTSFAPDDIMLAVKLELPPNRTPKFSKGFASATKNVAPASRSIRRAPGAFSKILRALRPAA
jgi:UDP-N-acetylmuramate dehydrogenase